MGAAELRHRVVAVFVEHAFEELVGALHTDVGRGRAWAQSIEELVEEQAAQRLRRARVPREQRAFYDLRQIAQRKHRSVQVGEVWR